jgi:hypothetical protein
VVFHICRQKTPTAPPQKKKGKGAAAAAAAPYAAATAASTRSSSALQSSSSANIAQISDPAFREALQARLAQLENKLYTSVASTGEQCSLARTKEIRSAMA